MPVGNIGYRLIMSATPIWLKNWVGAVQNPAYRVSGNKKTRHSARFFILFVITLFFLFACRTPTPQRQHASLPTHHSASHHPMDTNFP